MGRNNADEQLLSALKKFKSATAVEVANAADISVYTAQRKLSLMAREVPPRVFVVGSRNLGVEKGGRSLLFSAKASTTLDELEEKKLNDCLAILPSTTRDISDHLGVTFNNAQELLRKLRKQNKVYVLCRLRERGVVHAVFQRGDKGDRSGGIVGNYNRATENIEAAIRCVEAGKPLDLPFTSTSKACDIDELEAPRASAVVTRTLATNKFKTIWAPTRQICQPWSNQV